MKKLRAVTDDGLDALLKELRGTNLSKYVSEAAVALAEGRHKSQSAAWAAVEVASELHQTYAEFGAECARGLARLVPAAGAATAGEGGEPLPPLQRRLKLRILTDLLLVVRAYLRHLFAPPIRCTGFAAGTDRCCIAAGRHRGPGTAAGRAQRAVGRQARPASFFPRLHALSGCFAFFPPVAHMAPSAACAAT